MPQLTFMQKMSDKASRLLPSAFSEIVEDTTSEILTAPDYENIMFICDQTNQRAENAKDVVLAVRRRIEATNPKVQYFTIILLDALIKNCYEELHNQVADSLALQNFLIQIAVRTPIRDGEFEAKKAALQLILNMSYWFIGATEDKTKMLSKLADEVRAETTPLVFEDIEADPTFQLKHAPPAKARRQQPANNGAGATQRTSSNAPRPPSSQSRVVDAIPVIQYTGDQISGMLDSCMLLNEMLNTAEQEGKGVMGDDIITSIAVQVRQDHRKLSILLSSGAEMENLDVLLSVADSETAVIQRLSTLVEKQGANLREVAGLGANEDENSSVVLHQSAHHQPPQQITRSSPTVVPTTSTSSFHGASNTASRQAMDVDNHEVPMVPKAQPVSSNNNDTPAGYSPVTSSSPNTAAAVPKPAPKPQIKSNQDIDDFFGTAAQDHGDLNTAWVQGGEGANSSAAPVVLAKEGVSNNDFFDNHNAPSSSVLPATTGNINDKDDFDDFLDSRLPK